MKAKYCRWGILGTAGIARKNWQAIHDAGNAVVAAVASRDTRRAAKFAAECQKLLPHPTAPEALGSYEALVAHPGVDAIYLPIPTGLRKEWAIRAASAGKHVMVEKPVGINAAETAEIIAACRLNGVQFMDGTMFAHSRRLKELQKSIGRKSIGSIRRVATQFSFAGDKTFLRTNIRTHSGLEPLGCLGDLGWYCVYFTLQVMGGRMPLQATGRIHVEAAQSKALQPVPLEFSGELLYPDGVSATYFCSFIAENAEWAVVSGTAGSLHLEDFVLPFAGQEPSFNVLKTSFGSKGLRSDMKASRRFFKVAEPASNAPGSQESNLFRTMSQLVLTGKLDAQWPEISLKTQQLLDACLKSAHQGSAPVSVA